MGYEDVKSLHFSPLRRNKNRITNTSNAKTWLTNITVSRTKLEAVTPEKSKFAQTVAKSRM